MPPPPSHWLHSYCQWVGEDVVIGSTDTCIESMSTNLEEGERERTGEREGEGREGDNKYEDINTLIRYGRGGGFPHCINLAKKEHVCRERERGDGRWKGGSEGERERRRVQAREDEDSLAGHTWLYVAMCC